MPRIRAGADFEDEKVMPLRQQRISLAICTMAYLFAPTLGLSKNASVESQTKPGSEMQEVRQPSVTPKEWFSRYDQIRRGAEMTMADKFQSLLLASKRPEKRNAALASRMIQKYTTALTEMKQLESIPETKELQDGYIEYFNTARQIFSGYLDAQHQVPFTNQSLMPPKKKLEELDKKNKTLDADLRQRYLITKHKHS